MLEIESVQLDSPAAQAGLRVGDLITGIDGHVVRDLLDFHFHLGDDEVVDLEILRGTARETIRLTQDGAPGLGLTFAPMRTRLCGNDCVFCFIDQLPQGLRPSLYVKDEDYRLSFLHGNFVTLTNMKEWEIRRIVEQRLSPIYISVHSTNRETRRRLLRSRVQRDIKPILDYFRDHQIVMHTQIVLCPGYNDGDDLDHTIDDLAAYHPAIQSLAVVPLGLTDHRDGLVSLPPVTVSLAERLVDQVTQHQQTCQARWGLRFVYLADEWYRLLERPVPPETHYDGFPQIENGIGMTRYFLNRLARVKKIFPPVFQGKRATLVTGSLFRSILEPALRSKLEKTGERVDLQVVGVENDFFGRRVTVAGLLVGRDIAAALADRNLGDRVVIPPAVLNEDGLFLDSMTMPDLEARLGVPIHVGFRDRFW